MTLVSQMVQTLVAEATARVRGLLLAVGIAGTGLGAFMMGGQAIAAFSYEPAVATIVAAGYRCQAPKGWRSCGEVEIARAEARGQPIAHEYLVTFTFLDAKGIKRLVKGYVTKTGLPREEAVRGATFNLVYDPANPTKTSLPLGADHHALVVGLAGTAALAFHVFLFGLPSWPRRRSAETAAV